MDSWVSKKNTLFIIAFVIVLVVAAMLTFMLNRNESKGVPLFEQLTEEERKSVAAGLDQLNIAYQLDEQGGILIDEKKLQDAKSKLAASGFEPGAQKGFELFDTVDYGLNEFSQNILLQRALQGELAKTIALTEGVVSSRVHLVLGEKGVFRQKETAKASVTLMLEPGKSLSAQQVSGIQKLVASAIEGLEEKNVIVSDSRSVVLSISEDDISEAANITRKQKIESYLLSKASELLNGIYGRGNFTVSVDVDLDLSERQSEIEELLPSVANRNMGFLVKDKSVNTQGANVTADRNSTGASDINIDRTFEFGKRRERVIHEVGQIKRMTVSVVVPKDVSTDQLAHVKYLVSAALGVNEERKDRIEIFAMKNHLGANVKISVPGSIADSVNQEQIQPSGPLTAASQSSDILTTPNLFQDSNKSFYWLIIAGAIILIFIVFMLIRLAKVRGTASLSLDQREKLLSDIRQWLAD